MNLYEVHKNLCEIELHFLMYADGHEQYHAERILKLIRKMKKRIEKDKRL